MQLDHQFTVPAPVDEAWKVLLDVPRIAPCMPGATLDEVDGDTFTGSVKVKLGPISLLYKGQGHFVEVDETAHRLVMEASGKESRGSGTAAATVTSTLVADGDSTRVDVTTELKVTGRPAQFGRGMLSDVGGKLLGQFADCLAVELGTSRSATGATRGPEPSGGSRTPAPHAPDTSDTPSAGGVTAADDAEVEAIDLLQITGAQAALRRYGPVVVAVSGLAVLAWFAVRRRRG